MPTFNPTDFFGGLSIPLFGAFMFPAIYKMDAYSFKCTGIFTTKMPTDAYRGAGRPVATFGVERMMDELAAQIFRCSSSRTRYPNHILTTIWSLIVSAVGAGDAFSRRPLCGASRPFAGPILKVTCGSILRVRSLLPRRSVRADCGPTKVARGRAGVRAKAAVPLRVRNGIRCPL